MTVFITKKTSFDAEVRTPKFVRIWLPSSCDLKFLSHMTTYLDITQAVYRVVDQVNICKNWTV